MPSNHQESTTDTTAPRVTAVVLNWHGYDKTQRCLASLAALDYPALDIVLIDNGCSEFQGEVFPARPRVTYLESATNLGFAGGANLGIRHATEARYIWFVNNDATPSPDCLQRMVESALADPMIAIVGPKILRADDTSQIDSVAVRVDQRSGRFRLVGHGETDDGQYNQHVPVDAVTGCALLARAETLEELGGFDEKYFLYLEDVDLCLRARAIGKTVLYCPTGQVLHDRPPANQGRQSVSSIYYTTRNHLLLMSTHGTDAGPVNHYTRIGRIAAWNLAYALRESPVVGRLKAVLSGLRDYHSRRFGAA